MQEQHGHDSDLGRSRPWVAAGLLGCVAAVSVLAALVVPASRVAAPTEVVDVAGVRTAGDLLDAFDLDRTAFEVEVVRTSSTGDGPVGGAAGRHGVVERRETVVRGPELYFVSTGGTTMEWDTWSGRCTTTGQGGPVVAHEALAGRGSTLGDEVLSPVRRVLDAHRSDLVERGEGELRWEFRDRGGAVAAVRVTHLDGEVTGVRAMTVGRGGTIEAVDATVADGSSWVPAHDVSPVAEVDALGCARRFATRG